jgi:hypothetical protein
VKRRSDAWVWKLEELSRRLLPTLVFLGKRGGD